MEKKIEKNALKSHRERVEEMNKFLDSLSDASFHTSLRLICSIMICLKSDPAKAVTRSSVVWNVIVKEVETNMVFYANMAFMHLEYQCTISTLLNIRSRNCNKANRSFQIFVENSDEDLLIVTPANSTLNFL
jgi:hypothetical protein